MKRKDVKRGDIMVKKKFAILPIHAGDETRWLEKVVVKYKYFYGDIIEDTRYGGGFFKAYGWFPVEFIDD